MGARRLVTTQTCHFEDHTQRVDVVFDRYIREDSVKAGAWSKRVGKKKKPIRKLIDGPLAAERN